MIYLLISQNMQFHCSWIWLIWNYSKERNFSKTIRKETRMKTKQRSKIKMNCTLRESNPNHQLGKVTDYNYPKYASSITKLSDLSAENSIKFSNKNLTSNKFLLNTIKVSFNLEIKTWHIHPMKVNEVIRLSCWSSMIQSDSAQFTSV
jgi:hypothetical protein